VTSLIELPYVFSDMYTGSEAKKNKLAHEPPLRK